MRVRHVLTAVISAFISSSAVAIQVESSAGLLIRSGPDPGVGVSAAVGPRFGNWGVSAFAGTTGGLTDGRGYTATTQTRMIGVLGRNSIPLVAAHSGFILDFATSFGLVRDECRSVFSTIDQMEVVSDGVSALLGLGVQLGSRHLAARLGPFFNVPLSMSTSRISESSPPNFDRARAIDAAELRASRVESGLSVEFVWTPDFG